MKEWVDTRSRSYLPSTTVSILPERQARARQLLPSRHG